MPVINGADFDYPVSLVGNNTRPISKSELSSQGRFGGVQRETSAPISMASDYSYSPPTIRPATTTISAGEPSAYYAVNRPPGTAERIVIEHEYDERYSSSILDLPNAVYDFFVWPFASVAANTSSAVVNGTSAVVGAGVTGAAYVTGSTVDSVGYVANSAYSTALGNEPISHRIEVDTASMQRSVPFSTAPISATPFTTSSRVVSSSSPMTISSPSIMDSRQMPTIRESSPQSRFRASSPQPRFRESSPQPRSWNY